LDIANGLLSQTVKTITGRYPAIIPLLNGKARFIAFAYQPEQHETKTVEFYLRTMQGLIRGVYNGDVGGEFIDIMANLISGQLRQAYLSGAADAGLLAIELTESMNKELEGFILREFDHVDNIFRDIVDAKIDETPLEPLLQRAKMWANRWTEVWNAAKLSVSAEFGLRMLWTLGPTDHCETCLPLAGLVAFATEWETANLRPQGSMLVCGGFRCQCELTPTNARRSNHVADRLAKIPRK